MKSTNYDWQLLKKPIPFQSGSLTLWSNEYIAKNVLKKHLNKKIDSGSRRYITIEKTINWISKKYPNANSILDVGCGPGLYAPLFCQNGFCYNGFDISPYQISYARQHSSVYGKTHFNVCDLRKWESDNSYDIVLLLYGIYSFYSRDERVSFLKRIKRNLSDGGHIIIEIFTEKHYIGRNNSTYWKYIDKNGFWCKGPHLELNSFYRYDEDKLILIQTAIITHKLDIWNSWIQVFNRETIKRELFEAGFRNYEFFGSCSGEVFNSESDVLCVCAQ